MRTACYVRLNFLINNNRLAVKQRSFIAVFLFHHQVAIAVYAVGNGKNIISVTIEQNCLAEGEAVVFVFLQSVGGGNISGKLSNVLDDLSRKSVA